MPIDFRCPHCGLETEVDDHYAGQRGPCAGCGKPITVPYLAAGPGVGTAPRGRRSSSLSTPLLIVAGVVAVVAMLAAGAFLMGIVSPMMQVARSSAHQNRCADNLRQIAMAMEAYHDAYDSYPPPFLVDERGRPMHSWRVLILPYLSGGETLYEQYDFNLPWNDPVNIALARYMPEAYGCPEDEEATSQGDTNYVVVTGDETMFPPRRSKGRGQLTDAPYETVLVVESRRKGICWLDPTDLQLQDMSLFINATDEPSISSLHTGGAHVICVDGQCHFLGDAAPPEHVRALLTASGGETLPDDVLD